MPAKQENGFKELARWLTEGHQYCVTSVERMRSFLTDAMQKTRPNTPLGKASARLRRASRHFCDIIGSPRFDELSHPIKKSVLGRELVKLREAAGLAIAEISIAYGLDVEDELASIIPFKMPNHN